MEIPPLTPEQVYENNKHYLFEVNEYNKVEGNLPGENCDICKNKGIVMFMKLVDPEKNQYVSCGRICECMSRRLKKTNYD